jgi:hypothetical protein
MGELVKKKSNGEKQKFFFFPKEGFRRKVNFPNFKKMMP